MTKAEIAKMAFPLWCKQNGLGTPVLEHEFHEVRKYRFDFCWPDLKIAVECEGGVFPNKAGKSAHRSISGMLRDIEKYNLAAADGWLVLRQVPSKLCSAGMLDLIRQTKTKVLHMASERVHLNPNRH